MINTVLTEEMAEVIVPIAEKEVVTERDAITEEDLWLKHKKLQRQLEHTDVMEDYLKLEIRSLEKELLHAQEEVKRIQSVPLVIGYRFFY